MPTAAVTPAKSTKRRPAHTASGRKYFTEITARDRAIFTALFEHRFLTFAQLAALVQPHASSLSRTGHEKKLRERLGELFHAEHVFRSRTQLYDPVFSLAPAGADHVPAMTDEHFSRLDWLKTNKTASWKFIDHTVEAAEINLAVKRKLDNHLNVVLTTGRSLAASIRAAVKTPPTQNPLLIREEIQLDIHDRRAGKGVVTTGTVGTVPDGFFLLSISLTKQRGFPFELDRTTEPVHHRGFSETSIERKLRVYQAAADAASAIRRWGLDGFRVLFITQSAARSKNIRALARSIGCDVVWTCEYSTFLDAAILDDIWTDPEGKRHALLPSKLLP